MTPNAFVRLMAALAWVATGASLVAQGQKWEPNNKEGNPVRATCMTVADSVVWMGTEESGVVAWKNGSATFLNKEAGLSSDEIRCILAARSGAVWIGSNEGLDRWDGKRLTHYRKDGMTLMTNEITALHEDADGVLWIGTTKGLVRRLPTDRWSLFDEKNTNKGLPTHTIRSIHSNWNGIIWIATDEGLVSFDGKTWKSYTKDGHRLPSDDIFGVYAADDNNVWIATSKGVGKFDGKTCYHFVKNKTVVSVTVDLVGNGWAVTKDEGVYKIEGGNEKVFTVGEGLSSEELTAVEGDPYGYVWVAGKPGINQYTDPGSSARLAEVIMRKADEYLAAGDLVRSDHFYSQFAGHPLLKNAIQVPTAAYRRVQIDAARGDVESAVTGLKQFLDRYPKHALAADALLQLADFLAGQRKVAEAQTQYQRFLDNYPDDARNRDILWKMAYLLEQDGDTFGASRLYQKLNNKYPDNPRFEEIRWKIANMEEKQKGVDAVQTTYAELARTSGDPEILFRLSDIYDQQHRKDILQELKGGVEWKTYEMGSGVNYLLLDGNQLWVGTENNGVIKWDLNLSAFTIYSTGLTGQNVRQVYIDADGDVWAVIKGVSRNSLCNMQYSKKSTKWVPMGAPFNTKTVNGILYRQSSKSTITATDQGLIASGRGAKSYSTKNGLPSDRVKFVREDSRGVLWLICDKYLVQVDNEPKMIVNTGQVDFNDVRDFYIDSKDTKWLATEKGIVTYDGSWKQYTKAEGLISDNTQCVMGSRGGKLLVGTKDGLSFFNKTFWMNYTTEDGLPSNDVRAVLFTDDESIWIGTNKGVHFRKSSGDGDKKLMVQNVLAEEKLYWDKKQYAQARSLYALLSMYPDLSEWRTYKEAATIEKQGQVQEALNAYRKIRTANPKTRWVTDLHFYRIARQLEEQGQSDAALTLLAEIAGTQNPAYKYRVEESMFRIGSAMQRGGALDKAVAVYKQVVRLFPGGETSKRAAEALLAAGQSMETAGDLKGATVVYEDFLSLFPSHERSEGIRLRTALLYHQQSRYAEAGEKYSEVLKSGNNDTYKTLAQKQYAKILRLLKSN